MTCKLKTLGISLVAMFALSALGASTASAVDVITTGASPAILTGVGHDHVFKLTNASGGVISKFECTTAKFAATVKNGDSGITADVLYEGTIGVTPHTDMVDCNSTMGEMKVTTTGCAYVLSGTTLAGGATPPGTGDAPVWIECEPNKAITLESTSTGLKITIPAQTPTAGGVSYTNEAGGKVKVTATVTGVTFNCDSTFICTLAGISHHGNNTDYNGTVVMSGFAGTEGLPTPVTEGNPIAVEVS